MRSVIVIAHNIRSTHNVGSIFRTCDGFGAKRLILSGYTPYPTIERDTRLPHISTKLTAQIHKTALGAEETVPFEYTSNLSTSLARLKADGYHIVGLEQDSRSISLSTYEAPEKIALILGEEVEGISDDLRELCEDIVEIPMHGKKESFNVSVAAGIALYAIISQ